MTDQSSTLDSTTTAKTKVGFLSLPAELRIAIYELYFERGHLIEPKVINLIEGSLFTWTTPNQSLVEPSILNVSSQLRWETLDLYLKDLRKVGAELEEELDQISKPGARYSGGWHHLVRRQVYLQGQIRVVRQKIEDVEREME